MDYDMFVPFVPKEAKEAVADTLNTRWIGQGPKCDQFEKDFRSKFGIKYAASVNSGTAALETAYDLIGLQPGDEVITPVLTCTATNLPLLHRGVKIVFADVLEDTLCIDPEDVRRKVTEKTKAVVQVHLGGIKADVGEVYYGDKDGLPCRIPVVSDAAQALGIFTGDFTCCSFQAIKHITTGDGGMICSNSETDHMTAKLLRWFGIDREAKQANNWQSYRNRKMTFQIEIPGYKRQMNDIAAAMGIEGLKWYDRIMMHRMYQFDIYRQGLAKVPGLRLLDGPQNRFWLVTVLVDDRDEFARMCFEQGIDVNTVQNRNDVYDVFGGVRQDLPTMNRIESKYICLPIGMHLTFDQINEICQIIRRGW